MDRTGAEQPNPGTREEDRSQRGRPPPRQPGLTSVLDQNIRTLRARKDQEEAAASAQDRLADGITRFTGSMPFVYLHLAAAGFWIAANLDWVPGVPRWDESFVVLAMVASVEAIFLSTFVLISQNRMASAASRRADLDLQISLLAEHEVTRLIKLTSAIADHLGIRTDVEVELPELEQDVAPEAVLDRLAADEQPGAPGRAAG